MVSFACDRLTPNVGEADFSTSLKAVGGNP
jgi:hypothetical protein